MFFLNNIWTRRSSGEGGGNVGQLDGFNETAAAPVETIDAEIHRTRGDGEGLTVQPLTRTSPTFFFPPSSAVLTALAAFTLISFPFLSLSLTGSHSGDLVTSDLRRPTA